MKVTPNLLPSLMRNKRLFDGVLFKNLRGSVHDTSQYLYTRSQVAKVNVTDETPAVKQKRISSTVYGRLPDLGVYERQV